MTGAAKATVLKFVLDMGAACQRFHDEAVRGIGTVRRVQADEVWTFVGAKDKNTREDQRVGCGDFLKSGLDTADLLCHDSSVRPVSSIRYGTSGVARARAARFRAGAPACLSQEVDPC